MLSHKELKARALSRDDVKNQYDLLEEEFSLLEEFWKSRAATGITQAERRVCMIAKVVHKANLSEFSEIKQNLSYWLSRSPQERVSAVELLRRREHGSATRLQRVARVVQRPGRQRPTPR